MKTPFKNALVILTGILLGVGIVHADEPGSLLQAHLRGFQEVPSVSTPATGEFRARISKDEQSIDFSLTYENLQNTVTQAHIHVAQRGVNGSIVIWLCGTASNPGPANTQTCPQTAKGNTAVTGKITAADVVAATNPTSQLILAGELAEVIAAIRGGVAYANVHSTPLTTGGEIRGQIRVVNDNDDHGRKK
jgi:hypothetical protein